MRGLSTARPAPHMYAITSDRYRDGMNDTTTQPQLRTVVADTTGVKLRDLRPTSEERGTAPVSGFVACILAADPTVSAFTSAVSAFNSFV